jgi:hypothetical protein
MRLLPALALVACRDATTNPDTPPACAHEEWGGIDVSRALHVGEGQSYPTLEGALAQAVAADVIAIHDGAYLTGPLEIDVPGVRLVGRCRDTVTLGSTGEGMRVTAADVTVSGLTLVDGLVQAINFSGANARMTHARVTDARGWGITTSAIDLTVEDVEVLRTRAVTDASDVAVPVNIVGGSLDATDLLVDGSDGWGIFGSYLVDTALTLRRTRVTNLWRFTAVTAPTVKLEGGVEVDHVVGQAINATTLNSEGELYVHHIGWNGTGQYDTERWAVAGRRVRIGPGLLAEDIEADVLLARGTSQLEGAVIRGACTLTAGLGAVFTNEGSLTLTDVAFSDLGCTAVRAAAGASVTMKHVAIEGARNAAIVVTDSRLSVTDVDVSDVRAGAVYEGLGLFAENATVSGTTLRMDSTQDYGAVFVGSSVELADTQLTDTAGAGIVALGSAVELSTLDIRGVASAASRQWGGFGIYVGSVDGNGVAYQPPRGATGVIIEGGTITDANLAGLYVTDGVPLTVRDITVSGTRAGLDETAPLGDGVTLTNGSMLNATNLNTLGNARVGVLLDGSSGTLTGGTLAETPGLVQQSCGDTIAPVRMEGVAASGGVVSCDTGPGLTTVVTAPVWTDDITVLE